MSTFSSDTPAPPTSPQTPAAGGGAPALASADLSTLHEAIQSHEWYRVLRLANAIEDNRSSEDWERMWRNQGVIDDGLAVAPFEYQVAIMAQEQGVFCFDRTERYFYRPVAEDIHPNLSAADYTCKLEGSGLVTPDMWPFSEDSPIADFERGASPRWWTHGLIHTLLGFAWWPTMGEKDLISLSRFSESLSAWHWYWLCNIGREFCEAHAGQPGRVFDYCAQCAHLSSQDLDAEIRRERIGTNYAEWCASAGLTFLSNEAEAMLLAFDKGRFAIPPPDMGLSVGDACEYAVWNHRRMRGHSFGRWLDICCRPNIDYWPNPDAFSAHCGRVLDRLFRWEPVGNIQPAKRGRRVLQDVGHRLCLSAAHAGAPERYAEVLEHLGQSIDTLHDWTGDNDPEVDTEANVEAVEAILAEALTRCADAWEAEADETEQAEMPVFALGYRPTLDYKNEPKVSHTQRTVAAQTMVKTLGLHPMFGPLVPRVVSRERVMSSWIEDLKRSVNPNKEALYLVVLSWLGSLYTVVKSDPRAARKRGWAFRYSLRRLPDDSADWANYRLERNPQVYLAPGVFHPRWVEDFFKDRGRMPPIFPPREIPAPGVLIGLSPTGPLFVPVVGPLITIYDLAAEGATLAEAVEATSAEAVESALRKQAVVAAWQEPMGDGVGSIEIL